MLAALFLSIRGVFDSLAGARHVAASAFDGVAGSNEQRSRQQQRGDEFLGHMVSPEGAAGRGTLSGDARKTIAGAKRSATVRKEMEEQAALPDAIWVRNASGGERSGPMFCGQQERGAKDLLSEVQNA